MPDDGQIIHAGGNFGKDKLFSGMLKDGYDLRLQVTGSSMSPFIKTGSYVTLSRDPVSKLKIGDVVFCGCDDGSFKLHRLIQIKNKRLITKGDALSSNDAPFKKTDYQGRVIRVEYQCSQTVRSRNLELRSARMTNYLIAVYYRLKLFLICKYISLKSETA